MTDEEFQEGLDRWGGDLSAWPQAEAGPAARHLAVSVRAQAMLDEMVAMEFALAEETLDDSPPDELADRIWRSVFGAESHPLDDEHPVPRLPPQNSHH